MTFENLQIIEPILKALRTEGYEIPTPIQSQAIPVLLSGNDVLGSAQTGTGKTAAFAIPILQNLTREQGSLKAPKLIKSLILTPTRELAIQIKDSFLSYGKNLTLKTLVIFGGVPQNHQVKNLQAGVDILVATPGRLLDLMNQKFVDLSHVGYFVLDEADRMLDMGFINDVKKIIASLPTKRQTMMFSATMPDEIAKLAGSILINPIRIAVVPVETTIDAIDQKLYFVTKKNKTNLLIHILEDKSVTSALVFTRTKHGANKVVKDLGIAHVYAEAIHGNKSQGARQEALFKFKNKTLRVLVATDIAARGLDIDHLSHVFNYDLPEVPETYIHRIGRTGRAGLEGAAIAFCAEDELPLLKDIQNHIRKLIPVVKNHPFEGVFQDVPTLAPTKTHTAVKAPAPAKKIEPKNFSAHDAKNHNLKPKTDHPYVAKPAGNQPVQPQTPAPKPVQITLVAPKPVQSAPVTPKPVHNAPASSKPVQNAPISPKNAANRPAQGKPVQPHPASGKPAYPRPVPDKYGAGKPAYQRPLPNKPLPDKPAYTRPNPGKPATPQHVSELPSSGESSHFTYNRATFDFKKANENAKKEDPTKE